MTVREKALRDFEKARHCRSCGKPTIGQRGLSKAIGIDGTSLQRFLRGGSVRMSTLEKIVAWTDAQSA